MRNEARQADEAIAAYRQGDECPGFEQAIDLYLAFRETFGEETAHALAVAEFLDI